MTGSLQGEFGSLYRGFGVPFGWIDIRELKRWYKPRDLEVKCTYNLAHSRYSLPSSTWKRLNWIMVKFMKLA